MKKNFLYHCYIKNIDEIDESTKFSLRCINNYIHIFDGKKIVYIALDNLDDSIKNTILKNFSVLSKFDDVIFTNNHSTDRESVTFIELLESVKDCEDSMTFYAHNKGSTWPLDNCLKNWIFSMFFFNLDDLYLKETETQLKQNYTTSGILKKDCKWHCPSIEGEWHYSGAFFWINNEKFFNYDWRKFKRGRMSIESYLGQRIHTSQAYSTFVTKNYNFHFNV